jgi:hypothetical protein
VADFGEAVTSRTGRLIFRSHLQNGQRVATEYTIRPKATQLVFLQALITNLQISLAAPLPYECHLSMGRNAPAHVFSVGAN